MLEQCADGLTEEGHHFIGITDNRHRDSTQGESDGIHDDDANKKHGES